MKPADTCRYWHNTNRYMQIHAYLHSCPALHFASVGSRWLGTPIFVPVQTTVASLLEHWKWVSTQITCLQVYAFGYSLANRGGCTRCIGMYWDVFWMYQIKFGCINIPIHHRCIGMYFRGIVMYYKMYWDVFHNVLRCITILFRLTKYMPIHL